MRLLLLQGAGRAGSRRWYCNRRSVLAKVAWLIITSLAAPGLAHARPESISIRGKLCSLSAIVDGDEVEIDSRTGDAVLDIQLAAEANAIARDFNVRPGLCIVLAPVRYAENALAMPKTHVPGTRGTVLLGRNITFSQLEENHRGWSGLAVAGIMAHEFAHIFQFFNGYDKLLELPSGSVELIELHADFLAGYHLGLKRRAGKPMDIGAFMDTAYFLGDDNETSLNHHGRRGERQRAVREGYRIGVQLAPSINEAANIGQQTVREIARSHL